MRINAKRILAVLLTLVMVLGMLPTVFATETETTVLAAKDEVIVYYTNDVHTYIDGDISYDNIAALKDATAEQAAGVLLVDAGDHIQGTAYGSMDKGKTIIDLMNASDYNLATLGNHEFDYGMARALEVIEDADFPYVSANFYNEKDGVKGETVLEAYEVFEVGGLKIAFVGITTPETFTKSTPAYFQDEDGNYIYGISGGDDGADLYADVQKAIDAASKEADIVIALGHLGDDPASQPWTSEELIANTTGLDAFIDGHSHSTVPMKEVTDKGGNVVVLTQTGEYFNAIGRMSITADGKITTSLMDGYEGSDAEVKAIKDAWMAEVDEKLGKVIGYAEVTFDNYDENGKRLVRKYETNTGDLAADALYYLFDTTYGLDVDVAIMNGGGVRNKTITGEISYLTCKNIHTFGNVACLQTVTGQQILDALEWGARGTTGEEIGGFLHVSGITYDINTYIENGCISDDKGVWTGHEGDYRVNNVQVYNKETGEYEPLDLEAKYNLAGYNYTLRDLGDGFAMFEGAVNVLDYVMEDYMVLANYIQSFPVDEETGLPTITAENSPYESVYGEGRITINHSFSDVSENSFAYEPVQYVREQGYMKGMTVYEFGPTLPTTRGMFATVLYRIAGEPDVSGLTCGFTDVAKGRYYYNAITWAEEYGYVKGMGDGIFAPNAELTRAQMVTMLYRYEKATNPNLSYEPADLSVFTDADQVPKFAREAMQWAVAVGIIEGVGDGTINPNGNCLRNQMAAIIYRYNVVTVNLLATSDIHGQLYPTDYTADFSASGTHYQSIANVATFINQQREVYDNTYVIDCGDLIQGTPLTYYYCFEQEDVDDPAMKALRMIGYDLFIPGNHEFNYGMEILQRELNYLTSEATENESTVAVGCANYLDAATNSDESLSWDTWNDYAPYQLVSYNGVKVAIFAIANPNIPAWDVPANWEGIYFANPVDTYLHYEKELTEVADVIVVASHSGVDSNPNDSDYIAELVRKTNTIDVVFTGHEHRNGVWDYIQNADGVTIPVFSLSSKAAVVGQAVITVDRASGEILNKDCHNEAMASRDENRKWSANYEADPEILAAMQAYETATWNDYMLQPIGKATGDFTAADLGAGPSAFVDLVNKVQIWGAYDRTGENTPDDTSDDAPAMLSITAPLTSGSAENIIPEGDIVLGDMFKLYRYENWFYQITMSGKEVDTWLEYSASKVQIEEDGSVTILGGLTYYDVIYGTGFSYTIDPSKEVGDRVTITYNGEAVADDFTFTVVVNNYRYNGGGGYVQWLNDHGCEFTPNDESRVIYSTQYDMIQGEDKGQARNLLADYIAEAGEITPVIESTWSIIK